MMRRIAVVTGSRAEYGLLVPLLRQLESSSDIDLKLIVCAAHLADEFGFTKNDILADGFKIDAEVEMLERGDAAVAAVKSLGRGCIGFADSIEKLEPDLIVVLGDRFEMLAAVEAALLLRIPVAHLHGGEITEGAVDDAIRHAITKMAHLHFVAANEYASRVIQMGEQPDRVFNVGAIGLDTALSLKPMSRQEMEKKFQLPSDCRYILATFHAETLSDISPQDQIRPMLNALARMSDHFVVLTYPNADFGGRAMIAEIEKFVQDNRRAVAKSHLGQIGYLSAMASADAVIGNSSSGIIEAPSFGIATVNIGDRQKGRLRAPSVIDCANDEYSIRNAIMSALSADYQERAKQCVNPYGDGRTTPRVVDILRSFPLQGILQKKFFSIPKSSDTSYSSGSLS